jgi:hypothetical protein
MIKRLYSFIRQSLLALLKQRGVIGVQDLSFRLDIRGGSLNLS